MSPPTIGTCGSCRATLPEGARFCPSCGSAVLPDAEQRKVLTVLFADMTGSTELSARLDPERFREVLAAFYKLVSDELAALGGRAENFIGDAVLGVFGLPQAHDDDAVRAIRAALSMVEAAPALGEQMALPVPLRVRVGINTGSVAVGAAVGSELVLGAEVNLAARLQQSAGPGEVLVGPTTRQLAGTWIEFGPGRDVEAKGFDAGVVAYPVLGPSKGTTKRGIRFVGRRREIELLTGTFERVVERSRAHLVTLVGEPGIGKSRVAEEFLDRLPGDTTVLVGRATSFGENATFGPIAEMLLRRMGDPVEEPDLRRLLVQTVARSTHPSEAAVTTARLGLALGLGDGPAGESRYREGEVRAGLLTFATGLARSGPVVLVFEDLHLAQPALLQLIERLVREAGRVPLLVVCVARWDFLEDHPAWAGGIADAVTLWLEPLPEDEATELAMAAAEGMRREDAVRVAAHAGGNPFFIVETAAMLAHGDGARASGRPPERVLPPTVQAVIAERLDHLSPAARDLARKASVFARPAFELVDLELIAQPNEAALVELEDEEILVRDEEREGTWRFRHDLLRDVAYDSLTKRERLRLHLRIAEHLARPESADRYPRAIAYHLERAARASLDLDPKDRSLAERAVDALERAGDLARRGIESRAAIDLYERALALAGPESGYGPREAWILSAIGEAGYWLGEFDAAADALSRALEIGRDDTRIRAHASRYLADIYLTVRAEGSRSAELFAESLAASRELGDPFVLARTLLMAAWQPYWENDLGRARETFEEALAVARDNPSGDAWGVARALVGLSSVTSPAGSEGDVLALAEEAVRIGQKSGDAFTTAVARGTTAASLRRMMRLDEALDHSSAAVRTFRELDARWELASSLGDRGSIHRLAGRPEEAEADLREAYRLCRDLKERSLVTWTAAELVRLLVAKGEAEAARQLLDEPQARLAAAEPSSLASLLSAEALVALEEGDPDGARVKAREAVEVQRAQALPNPLAAQVWWTGRVFGAEAVGGARELEEARAVLEAASWAQALHEPDLVRARTAAGG